MSSPPVPSGRRQRRELEGVLAAASNVDANPLRKPQKNRGTRTNCPIGANRGESEAFRLWFSIRAHTDSLIPPFYIDSQTLKITASFSEVSRWIFSVIFFNTSSISRVMENKTH